MISLSVLHMYLREYVKVRSITSILLLRGGGKVDFEAKMHVFGIYHHQIDISSTETAPNQ